MLPTPRLWRAGLGALAAVVLGFTARWVALRLDAPPAASDFLDGHLEAPDAADRAEALLVQASRSMAVAP